MRIHASKYERVKRVAFAGTLIFGMYWVYLRVYVIGAGQKERVVENNRSA